MCFLLCIIFSFHSRAVSCFYHLMLIIHSFICLRTRRVSCVPLFTRLALPITCRPFPSLFYILDLSSICLQQCTPSLFFCLIYLSCSFHVNHLSDSVFARAPGLASLLSLSVSYFLSARFVSLAFFSHSCSNTTY